MKVLLRFLRNFCDFCVEISIEAQRLNWVNALLREVLRYALQAIHEGGRDAAADRAVHQQQHLRTAIEAAS